MAGKTSLKNYKYCSFYELEFLSSSSITPYLPSYDWSETTADLLSDENLDNEKAISVIMIIKSI